MESITSRRTLWFLGALLCVPFLVYLPSVIRDGFVSIDDSLLITKNGWIQSLTPWTVWHVFMSYDPELYIPLTLFTYQIEWAIVGGHPFLFHLTNLLLHIGSAVFIFLLLRRLFAWELIAFFGALLFALHPINTEAVAWAAARKDVLSSFFFFGSLFFYEQWLAHRSSERSEGGRQDSNTGIPRLSLTFFFLALLSKVTVATLPIVLILLDWRRGERLQGKNLRDKLPYIALSGVFIVIALFGKAKGIGSLGFFKIGLLSCKAVVFYLAKLLWPAHLSVIYAQQTPVTLSSPEFFVPVVLVLILLSVIFLSRNRWRDLSVGLGFFLLTLLPNFANFWKNRFIFFASDRYEYIPSLGLILIVCSLGLWILHRRPKAERSLVVTLGILSALLAFLTFQQTRVWQSDIALYSNVLRWYPNSALAANNLGDAMVKSGKLNAAIPWFEIAVKNDPLYIQAMDNAGNVERERGNYDKARAWYEKAIAAISPDPRIEDLAPRYLLGELLMDQGKTDEALVHFTAAADALPTIAEPHYNLGLQYQKLGKTDEAIAQFEKAIELDSIHIASRYHLAGLYAEKGRLVEARGHLEQIVAVDPGYEKAAVHLQNIRKLLQK